MQPNYSSVQRLYTAMYAHPFKALLRKLIDQDEVTPAQALDADA